MPPTLKTDFIAIADSSADLFRLYRFNGKKYNLIQPYLDFGILQSPSVAALSAKRIALYEPNFDQLRCYEWQSSGWVQIGNGYSIVTGAKQPICALSGTRICFADTTADTLQTYDFDGTDWSPVGNPLSITNMTSASITALSATRIAYIDSTNDDLRAYDFDGTDWTLTGNELNISTVSGPSITALTSSRIAFYDSGNDDLRAYDFDGTDWTLTGNELNISPITSASITAISSNEICFGTSTDNILRNYTFDGTDWSISSVDTQIVNGGNGDLCSFPFQPCDYKISGTVALNGTPVENASILVINQSTNEVVTEVFTDSSGDYEALILDNTVLYHLAVRYSTGGDLYNAFSLFDVEPVAI